MTQPNAQSHGFLRLLFCSVFGLAQVMALDAAVPLPFPLHAITVGKETPRRADYDAVRLASYLSLREGLYQKHSAGSPNDARAIEYLRLWSEINTNPHSLIATKELLSKAKFLLEGNCQDPLVKYFIALNYHDSEDLDTAIRILKRCVVQAEEGHYPAAFTYMCLKRLVSYHWEQGSWATGEYKEGPIPADYLAAFKVATRRVLTEPTYDFFEGPRDLYASIANTIGSSRVHAEKPFTGIVDVILEETGKAKPDWLTLTVRGSCFIEKAWQVRGGGWANEVKDESWPQFHKYLDLARVSLEAAWAADHTRPEPAELMIAVCMAQESGQREERYWFDQALTAERDSNDAFEYLSFAWTPRWGGSLQMINDLGEEALVTKDFSSLLPMKYIDAVFMVQEDGMKFKDIEARKAQDAFFKSASVFARTKEVFEGYLMSDPNPAGDVKFLTFRYAFVTGYEQRHCQFGLDVLKRNGMDYIHTSRHKILGLTPADLYSNLESLSKAEEGKK